MKHVERAIYPRLDAPAAHPPIEFHCNLRLLVQCSQAFFLRCLKIVALRLQIPKAQVQIVIHVSTWVILVQVLQRQNVCLYMKNNNTTTSKLYNSKLKLHHLLAEFNSFS